MASNETDFSSHMFFGTKDSMLGRSDKLSGLHKYLSEVTESERKMEEDGMSLLMKIDEMGHQMEIMSIQIEKLKILKEQYFNALKQQLLTENTKTNAYVVDQGASSHAYQVMFGGGNKSTDDIFSNGYDLTPNVQVPYFSTQRIPEHTIEEAVSTVIQRESEFPSRIFNLVEKEANIFKQGYLQNVSKQEQQLKLSNNTSDAATASPDCMNNIVHFNKNGSSLPPEEMNLESKTDSGYSKRDAMQDPYKTLDKNSTLLVTDDTGITLCKNSESNNEISHTEKSPTSLQTTKTGAVLDHNKCCSTKGDDYQHELNSEQNASQVIITEEDENDCVSKIISDTVDIAPEKGNSNSKKNSLDSVSSSVVEGAKVETDSNTPLCESSGDTRIENELYIDPSDNKADSELLLHNNDETSSNLENNNAKSDVYFEKAESNANSMPLQNNKNHTDPSNGEMKQPNTVFSQKANSLSTYLTDNMTLSENDDSYNETKTPLTSSAAYQTLIGVTPFPQVMDQQITIDDSESEDDVEKAMAMAVEVTEPSIKNMMEPKGKQQPLASTTNKAKTSAEHIPRKSISVPSGVLKLKLSEASRRALGLDSDSDDPPANKLKGKPADEDSDEFDFYD